ncbi:MAG: alpha/beta fold hydrolase [Gordonia sp. (in: high G+C Gram-positive bacteria)]|uniref:esterase/lipase family protein n=1 Tax=Gordonia sp. (in: high G+C Gram-positive bacteria) TaxID=84139 RepID=UPI0039E43A15
MTAAVAVTAAAGTMVVDSAASAAPAPSEQEVLAKYGRTTVSGKRLPIQYTQGVGPIPSGFIGGWLYGQAYPNAAPQGANDFNCKPKEGQNPVVLVHGTAENAFNNWAYMSPALKKAGYCVFAPNYGRTDLLDQGGMMTVMPGINGVATIKQSSDQLRRYIDVVLKRTGAKKVDIVAHSQGGLVARHYIKYNGGANLRDTSKNKVQRLVMLGTPNHGTTLLGIAAIGRGMADIGLDLMPLYAWMYGAGPIDQSVGSPQVKRLNHGRMTYPGIEYTSIETKYDEIVTPYTSAFIKGGGVKNILLQNGCEQDTSDHLSMVYSNRVLSLTKRALAKGDPTAKPVKIQCSANPWVFSF